MWSQSSKESRAIASLILDLSATQGFIQRALFKELYSKSSISKDSVQTDEFGISPASDKPRCAGFQTAAESSRGIEP